MNTDPSHGLRGHWQKLSTAKCAEPYPDELEFRGGTYLGRKGASGQRFIVWDAGGYQVIAGDQVKIDTATDEQVVYPFRIVGDLLTFTDRDGCTLEYRRRQ